MVNNRFIFGLALIFVMSCGACQSRFDKAIKSMTDNNYGVVVVNAPVSGVVRRVIAREGMTVESNAPIVEIAVQTNAPNTANNAGQTPKSRAVTNYETNKADIEKARAETVRAEIEAQRLTPMVASGAATQAQLDAARADFAKAKARLESATLASQTAQNELNSSQSPQISAPLQTEKTVLAQTSATGTIAAITVREGEKVTQGQPLATIRTNQ